MIGLYPNLEDTLADICVEIAKQYHISNSDGNNDTFYICNNCGHSNNKL